MQERRKLNFLVHGEEYLETCSEFVYNAGLFRIAAVQTVGISNRIDFNLIADF